MSGIDYHILLSPLIKGTEECGDIGIVKEYDDKQWLIALVDALGHGGDAYKAAKLAYDYLNDSFSSDIVSVMKGLHGHLKGARGAVAALCSLNIETGDLAYTGIGNITVKVMGQRAFTFVSRDGVIGYIMPSPHIHHKRLYPGDILLMHSDGIKAHFDPFECRGLFEGNAESIAKGLLERYGKKDDDASCIVMRYL